MSRAVDGSLEALGLEGHEALIVAHDDTRHPHVHVVANRVDPETGKAAKLGNSKLRLSRCAEGYEREQGRIRVERRGQEQRAAPGGRGGASPHMGPAASLGALPPRGHGARADAAGDAAGRRGSCRHDGLAACRGTALAKGRGPAWSWRPSSRKPIELSAGVRKSNFEPSGRSRAGWWSKLSDHHTPDQPWCCHWALYGSMQEAATAFRKEITASGVAAMPECQSSRTIRAAGLIAVPLPSWNELRNPSAGSDHSRISTTLGSEAGYDRDPLKSKGHFRWRPLVSPSRRFGRTRARFHCGLVDIWDSCCRGT